MIFSKCLKRRHPISFYIYLKYQHPVLYTCLDLTLIKNLQGPRITIEQFFCACYASTFYKILDLTTAAALKTVTFFNQVFICPLRPVLFKNHRIRWWYHNIHLNLVSILQNKSTELIRLLHVSLYIWVACCLSIWVVFWRKNKSLYHFFLYLLHPTAEY